MIVGINALRSVSTLILSAAIFPYPSYGETVIPLEIERGSIFTKARINGVAVRLGIDTGGAGHLRLGNDLVMSLGLAATPSGEVTTNAYGVTKEKHTLTLRALEIGGTTFENVPAFVEPEDAPVQGDPPDWWPESDGTIGREFLKQFLVVIDYENQEITLYDQQESPNAPCDGAPASLIDHPEGIYATEVQVDHGQLKAIWDTGASHSFIKEQVVRYNAFPLDSDENGTSLYRSDAFGLDQYQMGPITFVVLPLVEPQNIDVYIGSNFFAAHSVCLNARDGLVRVDVSR